MAFRCRPVFEMVAGLHCICNIMSVETVSQDVSKFNIGGSLVCSITFGCCRFKLAHNLPIWMIFSSLSTLKWTAKDIYIFLFTNIVVNYNVSNGEIMFWILFVLTWVYISVVLLLECPSNSWIYRRSVPDSNKWVAYECLSQ